MVVTFLLSLCNSRRFRAMTKSAKFVIGMGRAKYAYFCFCRKQGVG